MTSLKACLLHLLPSRSCILKDGITPLVDVKQTIVAQGWRSTARGLPRAGDQAMHLLYRLQHGQVYKQHQPNLAIVLISTNDLGAASCLGGESAIVQSAEGAAER